MYQPVTIPPYLQKGDAVGFVCPSGYMPFEKAQPAIAQFKQHGFEVVLGKTVGLAHHYFAGTDEDRLMDLQDMLNNPAIKAIFCCRGGYGLSRIIDKLDFTAFMQSPKWIVGFSDVTVLLAHVYQVCQTACIHAPMAAALQHQNEYTQSVFDVLMGKPIHYQIQQQQHCAFDVVGEASGVLIGGNLTIITHLLSSQSEYKTKDCLLFFEDVGEYLYNIDRMLIQLKRADFFKHVKGVIVGGFTDMKDTTIPFGQSIEQIIHAHIHSYTVPTIYHFPVSHAQDNYALKIGLTYQLSISKTEVCLKEM